MSEDKVPNGRGLVWWARPAAFIRGAHMGHFDHHYGLAKPAPEPETEPEKDDGETE